MLVDEWVVTLWSILNVRDKTIRDYKHLYKRHLQPLIGSTEIDLVTSRDLQVKLLSLRVFNPCRRGIRLTYSYA